MRELADQNTGRAVFEAWLNARTSLPNTDRAILTETYDRMRALHEEGRDHIWTYIVRNLTRPLWISLRRGKPDILIGNPPWLRYNAMSADLQRRFKRESQQRGLWAGGKVATHQDLSAYFFARSVERYLPIGGTIAFVMPAAALSRRHYAGFRSGRFGDRRGNLAAAVRFEEVWLFKSDVGHLFEVPSCVIHGRRAATAAALPKNVLVFSGILPRRDADREEADRLLVSRYEPWPAIATDSEASPYARLFRQGATIVPRRLAVVVPADPGRFGGDPRAPLVESRIRALDKAPWNRLAPLRGQVEQEFLRPLLLGESIAPFRTLDPATAIIPWDDSAERLLDSDAALVEDHPYLASWLRQAEGLWRQHGSGDLTLLERWDYHGELSRQFRVAFAASGTLPCALVVEDKQAALEHSIYWAAVRSRHEGNYLAAILNSEAARSRVQALQSEGQFGARHFDKVMLRSLHIPSFDELIGLHVDLADAAAEAEALAGRVDLPSRSGFQAKRKLVRTALMDHRVAQRIDHLVAALLS